MKNKFWKRFFILICVFALFALIATTNGKARKVTVIETVITDTFTFPQRLFTYAKKWITQDKEFFRSLDELKDENKILKQKNEELQKHVADYELIVSENKILKEHLKMQSDYSNYNVVVAEVISDGNSNWEKTYIINKGAKDGIKPNMSVITSAGLVGYVETVSQNSSKIVSIVDAGNSVSGRIVRTRDAVICKGSSLLKENGKLKIQYIPMDVELIEGDKVETSGMGGIYPKGIAIGKVVSFTAKKNPAENEAIVETFVDFNRLETVAVIIEESEGE